MLKKLLLLTSCLLSIFPAGCSKKTNPDDELKETLIAVFADNQLATVSTRYTGFLKNHLRLCKDKNVDVIMIPGDLVNNAVTDYYKIFENALVETYGDDESKYPEFVYTMGNHEWWDVNERKDPNAVKLYNRHARIDTKCLRRKTDMSPDENNRYTYGNFYKVVNGIPFFSISGENDSGLISSFLAEEIKEWLNEVDKLPSVKQGGPIFFSYHYAFPNITYSFGQGSVARSQELYDLIKNHPQIILFSGDTHFSGVNERTINQVDFTDINLGSSSYSRHVCRSVTMDRDDCFTNINSNGVGKDLLIGPVAENYDRTPHIHFVHVNERGNTIINRYFSSNNPEEARHLGLEWIIPAHSNKDNFAYTSARYENKEWANKMYGKDGLFWKENEIVTYSLLGNKLTVNFNDVTDYNYCEHYRILVTSYNDETTKYDYVSHYYKYESESHSYSFEMTTNYTSIKKIEVYAYDFFDNISINHLETN